MQSYHGYLLGVTELPSGDAFLKFFSREQGLVSLVCRKYSASKKKRSHLDFFRLLEVEVTLKNVVKSVEVQFIHESFPDYLSHQMGFSWLEKLARTMPEEKVFEGMFRVLTQVLNHLEADVRELCDVYFRLHLLEESGHIQRFDVIRTESYFLPSDFSFLSKQIEGSIFLPNRVRQFLELVRRSELEELLTKKDVFSQELLFEAQNILKALEEYHL